MQQRQAELDRRQAQQSLGVASDTAQPDASAATNDSAVLDRLTEQITERLQVEVRRENAKLMQDGAVGAQVESLVAAASRQTRALAGSCPPPRAALKGACSPRVCVAARAPHRHQYLPDMLRADGGQGAPAHAPLPMWP